jgi:hypothetical protein
MYVLRVFRGWELSSLMTPKNKNKSKSSAERTVTVTVAVRGHSHGLGRVYKYYDVNLICVLVRACVSLLRPILFSFFSKREEKKHALLSIPHQYWGNTLYALSILSMLSLFSLSSPSLSPYISHFICDTGCGFEDTMIEMR